jgi:RNA polymerase sigma factor (sigma-70 family)
VGFGPAACHEVVTLPSPLRAVRRPVTEAEMAAIYRDTLDALYGYVSRRCGGVRQQAEDVTQEAWLRAVREWQRSGLPDNPLAWLTTVARNVLLNQLRRAEPVALDAVPDDVIAAALERDEAGDSAEVAAAVNRALGLLPAGEARLLEQFHFERRRMAPLAEEYGISERAVEGRLRRARERLRAVISDDGTILPTAEGGLTA